MRTERYAIDAATVARLCAAALADADRAAADLSVAVVDDAAIRALNREYHAEDRATDVLAFPLDGGAGQPGLLGEVILSAETAAREAARRGLPFAREVALYAVHGTLHLLGHDDHDADDRRRMRAREAALLATEWPDVPHTVDTAEAAP